MMHRGVLVGQGASPGQGKHRLRDVRAMVEHSVDKLHTTRGCERRQLLGVMSVSRDVDLEVPRHLKHRRSLWHGYQAGKRDSRTAWRGFVGLLQVVD